MFDSFYRNTQFGGNFLISKAVTFGKHADAKPGSIAAKARMVQQFDEKNPKGKKNKN